MNGERRDTTMKTHILWRGGLGPPTDGMAYKGIEMALEANEVHTWPGR